MLQQFSRTKECENGFGRVDGGLEEDNVHVAHYLHLRAGFANGPPRGHTLTMHDAYASALHAQLQLKSVATVVCRSCNQRQHFLSLSYIYTHRV